jgi:hypothetical protein
MWILCGELQTLYADEFSDAERSLIPPTMDVVREVAAAGESAELARQAAELAEAWAAVRNEREHEASSGLLNVWSTFEGMVQEIAGITPRYDGAQWVTNAIIEPWREANHHGQGPILVDPNAEIADGSPTANTLVLFQHVVAEVAGVQEGDWEPAPRSAHRRQPAPSTTRATHRASDHNPPRRRLRQPRTPPGRRMKT